MAAIASLAAILGAKTALARAKSVVRVRACVRALVARGARIRTSGVVFVEWVCVCVLRTDCVVETRAKLKLKLNFCVCVCVVLQRVTFDSARMMRKFNDASSARDEHKCARLYLRARQQQRQLQRDYFIVACGCRRSRRRSRCRCRNDLCERCESTFGPLLRACVCVLSSRSSARNARDDALTYPCAMAAVTCERTTHKHSRLRCATTTTTTTCRPPFESRTHCIATHLGGATLHCDPSYVHGNSVRARAHKRKRLVVAVADSARCHQATFVADLRCRATTHIIIIIIV